jgi:hypothetical protein
MKCADAILDIAAAIRRYFRRAAHVHHSFGIFLLLLHKTIEHFLAFSSLIAACFAATSKVPGHIFFAFRVFAV